MSDPEFERLFDDVYVRACAAGRRLLGSPDEPEDVAAEALARAHARSSAVRERPRVADASSDDVRRCRRRGARPRGGAVDAVADPGVGPAGPDLRTAVADGERTAVAAAVGDAFTDADGLADAVTGRDAHRVAV